MYENNIKKELREKGRGVLKWINLTQYNYCINLAERMKKWQVLLNILIKLFFCNMRDIFS